MREKESNKERKAQVLNDYLMFDSRSGRKRESFCDIA